MYVAMSKRWVMVVLGAMVALEAWGVQEGRADDPPALAGSSATFVQTQASNYGHNQWFSQITFRQQPGWRNLIDSTSNRLP